MYHVFFKKQNSFFFTSSFTISGVEGGKQNSTPLKQSFNGRKIET